MGEGDMLKIARLDRLSSSVQHLICQEPRAFTPERNGFSLRGFVAA
jgi:hypothetical protein